MKKAAKKTTRKTTKTASNAPPEFEATPDDPDKAYVDFCYNRGYAVDRKRWDAMSVDGRAQCRRWVDTAAAGGKSTVPPALAAFDTNGGTKTQDSTGKIKYELACRFGRIGYKDSASIPCEIDKSALTPNQIEELMCETQIKVLIELRPNAERFNKQIKGAERPKFEFETDSRGYISRPKAWKFGLKFQLDIGLAHELMEFAGREGRIELTLKGPMTKEASDDGEDGEDDEDDDQKKLFGNDE